MSSHNQSAAIARLSAFVASYADMRGLDPEYVYSIHAGPDGGRSEHVRISDLRTLLAMASATPTPLPAAPDWRALCADLFQAIDRYFVDANGGARLDAAVDRVRYALSTPPAPPLEPRGCPTPGACSCPTAPIVPMELIRALELAEAALADIGDADREPGDDIAWAERRAAQDLPRIRHALLTWRDHATPPAATREAEHDDGDDAIDRWVDSKSDWIANWGAPRSDIAALIGEALEHWGRSATREAGPLPQAPTDEDLDDLCAEFSFHTDDEESRDLLAEMFRAVLARWGGAAVPSKAAPTDDDICDLADVFNGDPVPAIRRALELWGGATVPVPVSERPWEQPGWCDAEGRCWFGSERDGCIQAVWSMRMPIQRISHQRWCAPHWALPVPAAAAGEVQP